MRRPWFVTILAVAIALLPGCRTNQDVGSVVRDFFQEVNKGNLETAKSRFLARALINKIESPLLGGQNYLRDSFGGWINRIIRVDLENVRITGEAATVTAVIGNTSHGYWVGDVSLVKEDGREWKINRLGKFPELSLSERTTGTIKELKNDVAIYVFDRVSSFTEVPHVVDTYPSASPHLSVKYVDPDRQPTVAKEFGVRTYGTIVVAAGDRHVEARSDTEEGITDALVRMLKGPRTAYFIAGHGERKLDSADRYGFDRIIKQLGNDNYQTQSLMLMQKMAIPPGCTMVVIAGPQNDYLSSEIDVLRKYVQGGGRAMIMLDVGVELPNLARLLSDWNVTARNDLVIDQNSAAQVFGTSPTMPLIVKYGTNPIVRQLSGRATLFPFSRSFEISREPRPGVTVDSICETSGNSYDVTDYNPTMKQVPFRPGKDLKGPLNVAVAGSVWGGGGR